MLLRLLLVACLCAFLFGTAYTHSGGLDDKGGITIEKPESITTIRKKQTQNPALMTENSTNIGLTRMAIAKMLARKF